MSPPRCCKPRVREHHPEVVRTGHGVYELEDIRLRCRIDGETGCWLWSMSVVVTPHGISPRVTLPPGVVGGSERPVTMTVPRAAWLMSGRKLSRGQFVWRGCREDLCCNPEHLKAGTRADWGRWVQRLGVLRGDPRRSAVNMRNASVQTTPAELVRQAEAMLAAGALLRDVAAELGLGMGTMVKINRGRHVHQRHGVLPQASVFGLAAAARKAA